MPKKEFYISVYNRAGKKFESIYLNEEQYNAFRRGEWNIRASDRKFYKNEIQFSQLICGKRGSGDDSVDCMDIGTAYENFHEFVSNQDDPQRIVEKHMTIDAITDVLTGLDKNDLSLILALYIFGKTEREYAKEIGEHRRKVQRRKEGILKTLREKIEEKI